MICDSETLSPDTRTLVSLTFATSINSLAVDGLTVANRSNGGDIVQFASVAVQHFSIANVYVQSAAQLDSFVAWAANAVHSGADNELHNITLDAPVTAFLRVDMAGGRVVNGTKWAFVA